MDAGQGWATVTWSRYTGARFDGYRLERRTGEEEDFQQIERFQSAGDTVFTDSGLEPDVVYFYRVVLESAGEEWTSERSGRLSYGLSGIELLDVVVDELGGTAELTWSAYDGPAFEAYEIQRRSIEDEDFALLASVDEIADTAYADLDLPPDAVFFYRIVLRAAGENVPSNLSGRISLVFRASNSSTWWWTSVRVPPS